MLLPRSLRLLHAPTAEMAMPLSARSTLFARSSSLPDRAIAGAVVGSVVGAALIICCLLPFILRARRQWLARYDAPAEAEMGQSPGGPIFPQHSIQGDTARRLERNHFASAPGPGTESDFANDQYHLLDPLKSKPNGHGGYQKAASDQKPQQPSPLIPSGVAIEQGLPSPISPPISPIARFDSPSHKIVENVQAPLGPTAADQVPPAAEPPSKSRGSRGTTGKTSSRELSLTDSFSTPGRVLTGFTFGGITEEPREIDRASEAPSHHHFPHLRESIWSLLHRRRHSSRAKRRDSKRSTLDEPDGARTPSVIEDDGIVETDSPILIDPDAPGLAWDYYHDSTLGNDEQATSGPPPPPAQLPVPAPAPAPAPARGRLTVVTPPAASFSTPLTPISPVQQASVPVPATAGESILPMNEGGVVEEPGVISPDSDKTLTPRDYLRSFSRQSSLIGRRIPGGPPQRIDSFPIPAIVSDIQSPPLYNTGPSENPMKMMRPTNATENAWMLEQAVLRIQNPPLHSDAFPSTLQSLDEGDYMEIKPEISPEPEFQQAVPDIELNDGEFVDDGMEFLVYRNDGHDISDLSTPPPSSNPSTQNTPNTHLTEPFTASPSPASPSPVSDLGVVNGGQIGTSPRVFICDKCNRMFDQIHKLNHHKRYHDRPHECTHPGCNMRFGTKTHLDRHINDKHMRAKKFYCMQSDCPYSRQGGKSFPRKDNWRRHMLNKHSIKADSDPGVEFVDENIQMTGM